MKKMYVICLFLCVAVIVAVASYWYASANLGKGLTLQDVESNPYLQENLDDWHNIKNKKNDLDMEDRINNLTVIREQIYNLSENSIKETNISTPVYFLEMTKMDLLEYLEKYMNQPEQSEVEKGLVRYELVAFSSKEVVLRKTYDLSKIDFERYYAVIENGYIVIYHDNSKELYDYTSISVNNLPEYIRENLSKGIYFSTEQEMYDFLQTYSS